MIHMSNLSYEEEPQSSRIANMPFQDHVTELQYLRKEKPDLFKLNNDLSKKKFEENVQPPEP